MVSYGDDDALGDAYAYNDIAGDDSPTDDGYYHPLSA
jgi:hypothetical protein